MIRTRDRLYIDVVKGIAIILMLWGHCIQYSAAEGFQAFDHGIYQFIYSFHMPLFMLISGYLFFFSFEKRDLKTLLVHRIQGMLQPIVFANALNILLSSIPTYLLYRVIYIFDGALLVGMTNLWFLLCVLSSSIAVAVACKTTGNLWLRILFLILGVFFVALFPDNHYHLYMYPYFVAGFLAAMFRSRIPHGIQKCAWLSLPVFVVMLCFYKSRHLIYMTPVYTPDMDLTALIQLNLFRWGIGFAGSLTVLLLTGKLFEWTVTQDRIPVILKLVAKLGENSLAIYCLSISLLSYYLSKIFDRILLITGSNIFAENMLVYNFAFTPALTLAYCFGLYGAVQLLKKLKLHKLIFGR